MLPRICFRSGFAFLGLNVTLTNQTAVAASPPIYEERVARAKSEGEVVFMGDVATELKTLLLSNSKGLMSDQGIQSIGLQAKRRRDD